MQGFRKDYRLTFIMLGGLLVVAMVRILLSHIIKKAWKCKRRLLFWLIYFIQTQVWFILREKWTSLLTGSWKWCDFRKRWIAACPHLEGVQFTVSFVASQILSTSSRVPPLSVSNLHKSWEDLCLAEYPGTPVWKPVWKFLKNFHALRVTETTQP